MTILHIRRVRQLPLEERLLAFKGLQANLAQFSLIRASGYVEGNDATLMQQRIEMLAHNAEVQQALAQLPWLNQCLLHINVEQQHALYVLLAIGEGEACLTDPGQSEEQLQRFSKLLDDLVQVERLYKAHEGLIGYQCLCILGMIQQHTQQIQDLLSQASYKAPSGIDIRKKTPLIHEAIHTALQNMHTMAEFYVIGGAGERLKCVDAQTGSPLPAALLPFGGKSSLLEWLMSDLTAREALARQLTGKFFTTPVVLMTSQENHDQIVEFFRHNNWFSREKQGFFFIQQPLVPVLTEQGDWVVDKPLEPLFKPPGHGTLWWQLQEAGLFQSLQARGIHKVLIRQINNPFCGLDHGILAFVGLGLLRDKAFGFASCERKMGAPEGMDVLRELNTQGRYQLCLTNIEYVHLQQKGIEEVKLAGDSEYSRFPANTNILFADLAVIEKALKKDPLPGLLLNMKTEVASRDAQGQPCLLRAGRLESIMQNIADNIVDVFLEPDYVLQWDSLSSYLTYNSRNVTLSVIKNAFCEDKDPFGTPPACFYELQSALRTLLVSMCHIELPLLPTLADYLNRAIPFYLQLSFRLGPLYSLIATKISQGRIAQGSHLVLELANLWMHHLDLQGSLQVRADKEGSCQLENVTIRNQGIVSQFGKECWQGGCEIQESLRIEIEGDGVFHAKNLLLEGNISIHVPAGTKVTAYQNKEGGLELKRELLESTDMVWRAPLQLSQEGEISCKPPSDF